MQSIPRCIQISIWQYEKWRYTNKYIKNHVLLLILANDLGMLCVSGKFIQPCAVQQKKKKKTNWTVAQTFRNNLKWMITSWNLLLFLNVLKDIQKRIVISDYISSITIPFVFLHTETMLYLQQHKLSTRWKPIYSSQTFSETFFTSLIYRNVYSTMFATLFLLRNSKPKHVYVHPPVHPLIQ